MTILNFTRIMNIFLKFCYWTQPDVPTQGVMDPTNVHI